MITKIYMILLLCAGALVCRAQSDDADPDGYASFGFYGGIHQMSVERLNESLFRDKSVGFSSDVKTWGFGIVNNVVKDPLAVMNTGFQFTFFMAQKHADSLTDATLKGFSMHVSHLGVYFFRSHKFDAGLLFGFEYGRMKLKVTAAATRTDYELKNPFFALNPHALIRYNFLFWNKDQTTKSWFSIGVAPSYTWDIGKGHWKGTNADQINAGRHSVTGTRVMFTIAYTGSRSGDKHIDVIPDGQ